LPTIGGAATILAIELDWMAKNLSTGIINGNLNTIA
jgi:hypothetical protein